MTTTATPPRKRITHKGFEAKLKARAQRAVDAGKLPPCLCWSCIRRDGLTPPKGLRQKHPDRYPFAVFEKDPGGEPVPTQRKKSEHKVTTGSEHHNLREAVRNRMI